MDNLKKIEAFLDMPSDDEVVYGESLTEQVEDDGLPMEIRIPASEFPEYDEYYDDEDGELYTELTLYIEARYGNPVDFHWTITPEEIIISDITWFDDEDIEPEVEEQEFDFPEDDVMEDLNEAKLKKDDLTDDNLANFEMELQEIKDNLADFGPEGFYAVPYESFKREFPIFTEKVIESFLKEMEDDGEGNWQEGTLIWDNDWPCLIEGAEKLLNGKGFQWEKIYTKYYRPVDESLDEADKMYELAPGEFKHASELTVDEINKLIKQKKKSLSSRHGQEAEINELKALIRNKKKNESLTESAGKTIFVVSGSCNTKTFTTKEAAEKYRKEQIANREMEGSNSYYIKIDEVPLEESLEEGIFGIGDPKIQYVVTYTDRKGEQKFAYADNDKHNPGQTSDYRDWKNWMESELGASNFKSYSAEEAKKKFGKNLKKVLQGANYINGTSDRLDREAMRKKEFQDAQDEKERQIRRDSRRLEKEAKKKEDEYKKLARREDEKSRDKFTSKMAARDRERSSSNYNSATDTWYESLTEADNEKQKNLGKVFTADDGDSAPSPKGQEEARMLKSIDDFHTFVDTLKTDDVKSVAFMDILQNHYGDPSLGKLKGVSISEENIPVKELMPTQNNISISKSLGDPVKGKWGPLKAADFTEACLNGHPSFDTNVIVFTGGDQKYIIDGHHRWSKAYAVNPDAKIKCYNITPKEGGLSIYDVLKGVHLAIARDIGTVPGEEVTANDADNLLKNPKGAYSYTKEKLEAGTEDGNKVLEVFAKHGINSIEDVAKLIGNNSELMAKAGTIPGAPTRGDMPQTDKTKAVKILKDDGIIDVSESLTEEKWGRPKKVGPYGMSAPVESVKKIDTIINSMDEDDFDLLLDVCYDAYDGDKEAKSVVRQLFKKYKLPQWSLMAFVENWADEDVFRESLTEADEEHEADSEEEKQTSEQPTKQINGIEDVLTDYRKSAENNMSETKVPGTKNVLVLLGSDFKDADGRINRWFKANPTYSFVTPDNTGDIKNSKKTILIADLSSVDDAKKSSFLADLSIKLNKEFKVLFTILKSNRKIKDILNNKGLNAEEFNVSTKQFVGNDKLTEDMGVINGEATPEQIEKFLAEAGNSNDMINSGTITFKANNHEVTLTAKQSGGMVVIKCKEPRVNKWLTDFSAEMLAEAVNTLLAGQTPKFKGEWSSGPWGGDQGRWNGVK